MNDLNTNNSKKLITGISIVFCTIILIIGATSAYFTEGDTKEIGNIVSTDQVSLLFDDNDDYMLGDLIPIDEDKVEYAYNREDNLKCKDDNGYNVCSIYQFTITNTGNVIQDIIIDLYPKVNGFTNLKFYIYDITNNESLISKQELVFNSEEAVNLVNNLKLNTSDNKSNTYQLVFYIKNDPNNNQSHLDAGQSFSASIKVNSVTTGEYVIDEIGEQQNDCWIFDEDDTTKVNIFNGFNENGTIKTYCEKYFKEDNGYYVVDIPSSYGGKQIKTLGNNLFNALDSIGQSGPVFNKYQLIKEVNINEGIEVIENGNENELLGAFMYVGYGITDINYKLNITLPNTLTDIGDLAFCGSSVNILKIPYSVKSIGIFVCQGCQKLSSLTFETNNGFSNLNEIGDYAFEYCALNYPDQDNYLLLPNSITNMGKSVFNNNPNLKYIYFEGDESGFGSSWNGKATLLPLRN